MFRETASDTLKVHTPQSLHGTVEIPQGPHKTHHLPGIVLKLPTCPICPRVKNRIPSFLREGTNNLFVFHILFFAADYAELDSTVKKENTTVRSRARARKLKVDPDGELSFTYCV